MLDPEAVRVIYEQPLSERIRSFLRLEHLFARAAHEADRSDPWASQVLLECIIDVLAVVGRSDVKKELIKEIERHAAILDGLADNPQVDQARLSQVLEEVRSMISSLHAAASLTGAGLLDDELFCSVRQRSSIPAGTCDFDLPGYHFWLSGSRERRRRDVARWLACFDTLRAAIELSLRLVRDSAVSTRETAVAGFYQRTLEQSSPCQLVRVSIPRDVTWYPEISGGRHRFTVRFMTPGDGPRRPAQSREDIEFDLLRCVI